jgi:hypothetical protein
MMPCRYVINTSFAEELSASFFKVVPRSALKIRQQAP